MMRRIGIAGSGPMAGYALRHLIASETLLAITIFEADTTAGCGMPYRAGMNADEMYCNAFSREIPVFTQHLVTWLKEQDAAFLQDWGLTHGDIDARSFYPRVLLGRYLSAGFAALCDRGRAQGHDINVLTRHRVTDIVPGGGKIRCTGQGVDGAFAMVFDDVIIATGHDWPVRPQIDGVDLTSPWPHTHITALPATLLGILGSSLSAIDVLVALAFEHGEFIEGNGQMAWYPAKGAENLHITMVSHNGIMPEPDFFYAYPFEPLHHITPEAVAHEIAQGPEGLLGRVFTLLIRELRQAAPDHLDRLGGQADTIEGFCSGYLAQRTEVGGLRALRTALHDAVQSFEDRQTQAHRYAMLRGHENFEPLLDHLSDDDRETFHTHLAPVFADCYAAIPHISVRRVLALHDAGVIDLVATREGATFSVGADGISVDTIDGRLTVDHMIDARGQPPADVGALPFPSLVQNLGQTDAPLLAPYRLAVTTDPDARVYCLAMPQVLAFNPFAQGLANCAALSKCAVADLFAGRDLTVNTSLQESA